MGLFRLANSIILSGISWFVFGLKLLLFASLGWYITSTSVWKCWYLRISETCSPQFLEYSSQSCNMSVESQIYRLLMSVLIDFYAVQNKKSEIVSRARWSWSVKVGRQAQPNRSTSTTLLLRCLPLPWKKEIMGGKVEGLKMCTLFPLNVIQVL